MELNRSETMILRQCLAAANTKREELERNLDAKIEAKDAEIEALGIECDRRGAVITAYQDALQKIADYAHDASTGPAVPDAFWEIRTMAMEAI